MSDYHHNPLSTQVARRSSTRVSLQGSRTNKRQSQYSLLNPNVFPVRKSTSHSVHRPSSVAETEESYDPYRPSRTQISKSHADHMRVTVLRGMSQQSARQATTRAVSQTSSKYRSVVRAQHTDDTYIVAGSPPATRMHSAGTSQLQRLAVNRRISRGSSQATMASRRSAASVSSIIKARKSTSYKRNVSFIHHRKRSLSGRHPHLRSREHQPSPFTLQERFARDQTRALAQSYTQDQEEDEEPPSSPPASRSFSGESPEPEEIPIVRSRKAPIGGLEDIKVRSRVGSHYFRDDARKVSTEIEKLCDEAFNKLPVGSGVTTPGTIDTGKRDSSNTYRTYQSSITSISMHDDSLPMRTRHQMRSKEIQSSYQDRPLPKPPATERPMDTEHLVSYTQRELAKARDLLKRRVAEADMGPGFLDEVIVHLDRLMQPSFIRISDDERRAASTPDPNSGIPRKDTFEQILEKNNIGFRSASEPVKGRESTKGQTVRLVGSPSSLMPISPVKPLTIRKKSESSTPSSGSPRKITSNERLVTTEELYGQQARERRSAGLAPLDHQSLAPIEEDEDKENFDPAERNRSGYQGEPKKRNWFRRRQQVLPPPPPLKDHRASPEYNTREDVEAGKRRSDLSSQESQISEPKTFGKGRFLKIFSAKRSNKESSKVPGADYDLDDGNSLVTEDSTRYYDHAQTYMSGALTNTSVSNIANRGSNGSRDDKLMPPPPIPRGIQPQHQNWLARFLRIKPAVNIMCFQVSKVKARKEVAAVFREWRRYGMRDIVVDKAAARIWAKVDVKNCAYLALYVLSQCLLLCLKNSSANIQIKRSVFPPSHSPPSSTRYFIAAAVPIWPSDASLRKKGPNHLLSASLKRLDEFSASEAWSSRISVLWPRSERVLVCN